MSLYLTLASCRMRIVTMSGQVRKIATTTFFYGQAPIFAKSAKIGVFSWPVERPAVSRDRFGLFSENSCRLSSLHIYACSCCQCDRVQLFYVRSVMFKSLDTLTNRPTFVKFLRANGQLWSQFTLADLIIQPACQLSSPRTTAGTIRT